MTQPIILLKRRKVPRKTTGIDSADLLLNQFQKAIAHNDFDAVKLEKLKLGYQKLSTDEKAQLFSGLIEELNPPKEEIEDLLQRSLSLSKSDPEWSQVLSELHDKIESPRLRLFRKFINVSEGLPFLLNLRQDILKIQRKSGRVFAPLDKELSHLFNSWFQNGFLVLTEISQNSPYSQIDYIQRHDMVHPMNRLEEMGDRLGHDRRCFALYHLAMPHEPVVFIEVALTKGITRSIRQIIGQRNEKQGMQTPFDTAIFYSINSTQNGLAGIRLGKVLIFQVVDHIKKTVPQVKTFSTLSPIPGFWQKYLKSILTQTDTRFKLTREKLLTFFPQKARIELTNEFKGNRPAGETDFFAILHDILADPHWVENRNYLRILKKPLKEITYFYLAEEKDTKGHPLNPVANFHLTNGASVTKSDINFLANHAEKGVSESCGMMVNYVYSQSWFNQVKEWGRKSGLPI